MDELYKPLKNTVPAGGTAINYDPELGYANISEIEAGLDPKSRAVFSQSIGWFGTESLFGLERLHGKTAREVVETINCLKTLPRPYDKENEAANECFNN